MKKLRILTLLLALLGSLWAPAVAGAVDPTSEVCRRQPNASICDASNTSRGRNPILGKDGIITKLIQVMVFVTAIVSVIGIMVGGLRYVVSNGDPGGVKQAKEAVIYSLVGLVIAIFAQGIVTFVVSKL